ncbi:Uncharacterised protein [Vibrio cholerae]|nr:Uncharacterised protein [Vibrio cholerae]
MFMMIKVKHYILYPKRIDSGKVNSLSSSAVTL